MHFSSPFAHNINPENIFKWCTRFSSPILLFQRSAWQNELSNRILSSVFFCYRFSRLSLKIIVAFRLQTMLNIHRFMYVYARNVYFANNFFFFYMKGLFSFILLSLTLRSFDFAFFHLCRLKITPQLLWRTCFDRILVLHLLLIQECRRIDTLNCFPREQLTCKNKCGCEDPLKNESTIVPINQFCFDTSSYICMQTYRHSYWFISCFNEIIEFNNS